MKRSLILLLAVVGCAAGAFAAPQRPGDDSKPLACASILYVSAAEDCEIFLDGTSFGKAPVVISDLSAGPHELRATSGSLVYRRSLVVGDADGVTRIAVALHPPWGSIAVDTVPAGSRVVVDGVECGRTPVQADMVSVGQHDVLVTAEGRIPFRERVDVREEAVARVAGELVPGYVLRFSPSPPHGAVLSTGTENSVFPDIPALPAGLRQFTIRAKGFREFGFSADPSDQAAAPVRYDPAPVQGFIRLVGARAGSTVFVDGTSSAYHAGAPISVSPGLHSLRIIFPGLLPFSEIVSVEDGRTAVVTVIVAKDPQAKRQLDFASAWPFLAIGGVLSVAGAILNADGVAIAATSSYSGYSTWKYATLGALGAGIGVTGGGLYVLLFKD